MKIKTSILAAALLAIGGTSAWEIFFQDGAGHEWNTHGTSFGDCIDLSPDWWDTHNTKFVNFRPATDFHTDPTAVRVYTSRKCGGSYDRCASGVTTFNPPKKIKSYKVV